MVNGPHNGKRLFYKGKLTFELRGHFKKFLKKDCEYIG